MPNWNLPLVTSNYVNVLTELRERDDALATLFLGTPPDNIPTDTVRLNSVTFQRWNGASWANIGQVVSTAAQTFSGNKTFSNDVIVGGNINNTSDRSLKKNIKPVEDALGLVNALNGVHFEWKETDNKAIGFIAQEVETVLPELVTTGEDGLKAVAYSNITAVLVEAVKQLAEQNRVLSERLSELESK
jgi:hypothetical protein